VRNVLGRRRFVAYGRRLTVNPESCHERLEDFPKRYLIDFRAQTEEREGFAFQISDECAICGAVHRVWLTRDGLWNLVPKEWRKKRLCVGWKSP
jgi:hypothetical protein